MSSLIILIILEEWPRAIFAVAHKSPARPLPKKKVPCKLTVAMENGKLTFRRCIPYPIGSMYGIFTYIYHKNQPNVGKYTIHGSYGYGKCLPFLNSISATCDISSAPSASSGLPDGFLLIDVANNEKGGIFWNIPPEVQARR